MDERSHLHDGEELLYATRSSGAHLLHLLMQAVPVGIALAALFATVVSFLLQALAPLWVIIVIAVPSLILPLYLKWRVWQHGLLRITTDRIVIESPEGWWHPHTRTVKWSQYQECETGKGHLLGTLFGAKSLQIRFGSADSHDILHYPYVYMAGDIKHYLDKIDRQVRMRDFSQIRAFVPKKKGQRY